jgi:hypothetical protein
MTYPFSQSCICFSNLQRVQYHTSLYLASRLNMSPKFTRAHVCAKTLGQTHHISTTLSCAGRCWHSGKAPIHLCYSGRVLGLGSSPSVALFIPSLLVNYNFAYGCFSSCIYRPILRLGESCSGLLCWLAISQLAGQEKTMASGGVRHPPSTGDQTPRGKASPA